MVEGIEVLLTGNECQTGIAMLNAVRALKLPHVSTGHVYRGERRVLLMWGVGEPQRAHIRRTHLKRGGRVVSVDMGYFHRTKISGYCRVSIDHDHPWRLLDATPPDNSRWTALNLQLREVASPTGHVIVVGMGAKSKRQLSTPHHDEMLTRRAVERFGAARVVYRPKPSKKLSKIHKIPGVRNDASTPIESLLQGAALVVCHHSNAALDAALAGVPFECEDGIAYWLRDKPYTVENRLALLHRAAWWQWRPSEARQMLDFLGVFL